MEGQEKVIEGFPGFFSDYAFSVGFGEGIGEIYKKSKAELRGDQGILKVVLEEVFKLDDEAFIVAIAEVVRKGKDQNVKQVSMLLVQTQFIVQVYGHLQRKILFQSKLVGNNAFQTELNHKLI